MNTPNRTATPLDTAVRSPQLAGKLLLTKRELSRALPMPERTIEKLVAVGTIPALKITPRMVRFELSAVLAALRQYETATFRK